MSDDHRYIGSRRCGTATSIYRRIMATGVSRNVLLAGMSATLVVIAVLGAVPSLRGSGDGNGASRLVAFGDPLASGIFLGAGLVHMLPDAAEGFAALGIRYPWPFAVCGGVALALALIERAGSAAGGAASPALFATATLAIHSLLAGAALGATSGRAALLILFLALIAHKGAASFSLSRLLVRSTLPKGGAIGLQTVFVLALPMGVGAGAAAIHRARDWPILIPAITAVGAGTFLYFGAMHHVESATGGRSTRSSMAVAGFAIMAIVAAVA